MNTAPAASAKVMLLIRVAMTVGVVTFIVVAWALRGRGDMPVVPASSRTTLTTVMYAAVGIAAAIIVALKLRIAGSAPAMARSLSVVAWAVGEFAAIFGGVMLFLTGELRLALPGVLVFAMCLALVRIPD